jgi:hypothetical protein
MRIDRQQLNTAAMATADQDGITSFVLKTARRGALRAAARTHGEMLTLVVSACLRSSQEKYSFAHPEDRVGHLLLLFEVSPRYDEHPTIERWLLTRGSQLAGCIQKMVSDLPEHVWSEAERLGGPAPWANVIEASSKAAGADPSAATAELSALLSASKTYGGSRAPGTPAARARRCAHQGALWAEHEAIEPCKKRIPRWIFSW